MLQNIQFFGDNLVTDSATDIITDSLDPYFDPENLKSEHTTKVYRSLFGVTTSSITFDFKQASPVNAVLVKGSTISGIGFIGDITIKANPTDANWGSPAFQTTLTAKPKFNFGSVTFDDENYRFWRIEGSGTDYFELSNIYIGPRTYMSDNNIDLGWSHQDIDNSNVKKNEYGQEFFDIKNIQRSYRLKLQALSIQEKELVSDLFLHVRTFSPLWIILNETEDITGDLERYSGQFKIAKLPKFSNTHFGLFETSLSLREVV